MERIEDTLARMAPALIKFEIFKEQTENVILNSEKIYGSYYCLIENNIVPYTIIAGTEDTWYITLGGKTFNFSWKKTRNVLAMSWSQIAQYVYLYIYNNDKKNKRNGRKRKTGKNREDADLNNGVSSESRVSREKNNH